MEQLIGADSFGSKDGSLYGHHDDEEHKFESNREACASIGMMICRRIVERNGGRIGIEFSGDREEAAVLGLRRDHQSSVTIRFSMKMRQPSQVMLDSYENEE